LFNNSNVNINLATYVIYNHDGSNSLSTLQNTNIAPFQYRVIGPTQLGKPTIAGSGLASTDFLALVNTSPSDQTIDVVNYGGAPDPNWPNYDQFSSEFFDSQTQPSMIADNAKDIQRWPDGQDTDAGRDWAQITRSPGTASCDDPYEPEDDNIGSAPTQNIQTTNLHRICPAGDNDYITLQLNSAFTYTLQANAVGSLVDTVLRLYDSSGTTLVGENDPDPGRNSQIIFRPSSSATYKAQITDRNGQGGSGVDYLYNFSITQQSAASPTPLVTSTATPTACEDAYEPDNQFPQEAKNLELNTEQIHTFCRANTPQGDTDWLRFVASAGKVYTFYTKDLSGPTDTIMSLHNGNGDKLYENDDYQPGQGLASRIDWSFTTDGVYYIRLREKRAGNSPAYRYTVGVSTTGQLPNTGTPTATSTTSPFSPTPTMGPCYDGFEPDGVAETAKIIYIGQTQQHNICPTSDADWVKFYGRAGKAYTIATDNLGIGLDTYMWIFASDASTILAYNDDGGNGVSSRIDFIPIKDDFYYVQVKNAGDLGLPEMTYDLSLAVTAAPPQPPSTATGIIAPPVTVTPDDNSSTPTTIPLPTRPGANTPTQGPSQPTPDVEVPSPVSTAGSGNTPTQTPKPTLTTTVPPQVSTPTATPTTVEIPPTEVPVDQPTEVIPGVPGTGVQSPPNSLPGIPVTGGVNAPVAQIDASTKSLEPASVRMAPMLFRIFYDGDNNETYATREGIQGISVMFLDATLNYAPTATLVTSVEGEGRLQVPIGPQKVYIPYFGIYMNLTRFPERELHSIWIPAVKLPERVP
ncbi:MAG: pre-peptidase C-terminal domain-containing protein, partial [Chloroflexia bacterium]